MGNRAHVIFASDHRISPAVYLHWNGGPESVYAFLDELRTRGVREDTDYAMARFTQIVGEFFGATGSGAGLSLGILNGPANLEPESLDLYDHGDNGVYVAQGNVVFRYVRKCYAEKARFLTPTEVATEREFAESDGTYASIATFFKRYRAMRDFMNEVE